MAGRALLLALATLGAASAFNSAVSPRKVSTLKAVSGEPGGSELGRRSFVATLVSSSVFVAPVLAMQEYIAEPSADFLASEKQAAEFKKKQTALKRKFQGYLDDLAGSVTDDECTKALKDMRALVIQLQDLPAGFQKESLRTTITVKKKAMLAKGLWGTSVDIAFKELIQAITLVQSPNRMTPYEG